MPVQAMDDVNEGAKRTNVRTILNVLAKAQRLFDLRRIRETTVLYTQGQRLIIMSRIVAYQ
jgi:hypothetical protein